MNRTDARIHEILDRFVNNEKSASQYRGYTLGAITALLAGAGNPDRSLRAIHIAGTNGKGSVAHMLNRIFITAGYRTGLYTSPHLVNIRERILVDGRMIPAADFLRLLGTVVDHSRNADPFPTWFDVITFIAFSYFFEKKMDIAIIETGLGGRLDSTNVISPFTEVITSISLDHTAILGDSIEKIAAEKAGIIKHGTTVVASSPQPSVLTVLREKCRQENARFLQSGHDFTIRNEAPSRRGSGYIFDFEGLGQVIKNIRLRLRGRFQIENAACAIAAALTARENGFLLTMDSIREGIARTVVPGRFLVLPGRPAVIFDPAHNPGAVSSLLIALLDTYANARFCFVIGLMKDKDCRAIMTQLTHLQSRIFYFELDDPRALSFDGFRKSTGPEMSERIISATGNENLEAGLLREIDLHGDTVVVVTGSFRLYDTARTISRALRKKCS